MRAFGNTGLTVPMLGLGASQIGSADMAEADVERLLHHALDSGVTLIDTAHCYGDGLSEERIGRHVAGRRDEFILSTKCGHALDGYEDWTPEIVRASVALSLERMRTDHLDILHLHSCDIDALEDGRLADTMDALRDEGTVGVVAYSGDNDALAFAVDSGRFASIEASVSIADQHNLRTVIGRAAEAGLGVIVKRGIANGIWRHTERPTGTYGDVYWDRLQELAYDTNLEMGEFALRFSAFAPGVSLSLLGTTNPDNITRAIAAVEQGPLPDDVLAHIAERWDAVGQDWDSQR
ncbi:MAG: aldo/keto reductase [Propionibacteriaceae bacterium]|nr:aldo/keto reductase [Propionibacteriaceae bacterium]